MKKSSQKFNRALLPGNGWVKCHRRKTFPELRRRGQEHQIEQVGAKLRSMMSWISDNKVVDKAKN